GLWSRSAPNTTMDPRHHPEPPRLPAAEDRSGFRHDHPKLVGMLFATLFVACVAHADDFDVERTVRESLALCKAADDLPDDHQAAALAHGLALAEAAVAHDDRSARAHFAIVCNLGKATSRAGLRLGTFGALYRIRREIDVALTLAPDDPEALTTKGAL